jgi:hypothetical protein
MRYDIEEHVLLPDSHITRQNLVKKSAANPVNTYRTQAIGTLKIHIICHIPLHDKTVAINASKFISSIFLHKKDNSEQYVNQTLGPFLK